MWLARGVAVGPGLEGLREPVAPMNLTSRWFWGELGGGGCEAEWRGAVLLASPGGRELLAGVLPLPA